ncbi:hypothetical protein IEO21_00869 [Rhodonia placenta]|uniref:HMG box domain-containing protein n=1 Tax=Rhodonia placenta TaxID=104341 RepID=A0A8H7PAU4_9APHY|nr:hypothetical protein IEO21_00869 [Postia placenta]
MMLHSGMRFAMLHRVQPLNVSVISSGFIGYRYTFAADALALYSSSGSPTKSPSPNLPAAHEFPDIAQTASSPPIPSPSQAGTTRAGALKGHYLAPELTNEGSSAASSLLVFNASVERVASTPPKCTPVVKSAFTKPPNAFILFRREFAKNQTDTPSQAERSCAAGVEWNGMTQAAKEKWYNRAAATRQEMLLKVALGHKDKTGQKPRRRRPRSRAMKENKQAGMLGETVIPVTRRIVRPSSRECSPPKLQSTQHAASPTLLPYWFPDLDVTTMSPRHVYHHGGAPHGALYPPTYTPQHGPVQHAMQSLLSGDNPPPHAGAMQSPYAGHIPEPQGAFYTAHSPQYTPPQQQQQQYIQQNPYAPPLAVAPTPDQEPMDMIRGSPSSTRIVHIKRGLSRTQPQDEFEALLLHDDSVVAILRRGKELIESQSR